VNDTTILYIAIAAVALLKKAGFADVVNGGGLGDMPR
jgi:hypothetical protein